VKVYSDGRKILSQPEQERIVAMYQGGQSQAAIARVFECNEKTIKRVLNLSKVEKRTRDPKNFSPGDCQRIIDLYEAGQKLDDIAAIYRCSRGPIRSTLKQFGVAIRPGGDLIITDEVARQMLGSYRQGKNQKQIAQEFRISAARVHHVLSRFDVVWCHGGNVKVPPADYPKIVELYRDGGSTREIGKKWGCARQTIADILRRAGILRSGDRMPTVQRQEPLTLTEMERRFWQDEDRAVDMIMLPPDLRSRILGHVRDVLRYAFETLTHE